MSTFKFMSMLRSTDLSPTHQKEVSTLSSIRFRFSEKRRPDDYAVWVTDKLSWPVPRELVIKAPQVVSEWDPDGVAQAVAFRTLEELSIQNSRTVLMAKKEEFERTLGPQQWQIEPWYGTQYRVERLDDAFVREVRRSLISIWDFASHALAQAEGPNTIDAFRLPRPNEFIPKRLEVDKREVTQVRPAVIVVVDFKLTRTQLVPAAAAPSSDISKSAHDSLAQEGRPVLGTQGSRYH